MTDPQKSKQTSDEMAQAMQTEVEGSPEASTATTTSPLPDWLKEPQATIKSLATIEPDEPEAVGSAPAILQASTAQAPAIESAQVEALKIKQPEVEPSSAPICEAAPAAEAMTETDGAPVAVAEKTMIDKLAEEKETTTETPIVTKPEAEATQIESHEAATEEATVDSAAHQPSAKVNPHVVELVKVTKSFKTKRGSETFFALKDFDFTIEAAESGAFVVLLGPSGCGKSTILSLISGLSLASDGEVRVFGKTIDGPCPDSVTVSQAYTCFPWLNVLGNVEFGLGLEGVGKKERRERAMEYLRKVDLADRCDAYPKELSGGMQQRVAIARTLAMKLPIVLMDEPFGALDAQTRSDMQQMVLGLWEQEKNTIIFVTHDISEALLLGDRIVVFSSRPAKIIEDVRGLDATLGHERPPDLMRRPEFIELHESLRSKLKKLPASQLSSP